MRECEAAGPQKHWPRLLRGFASETLPGRGSSARWVAGPWGRPRGLPRPLHPRARPPRRCSRQVRVLYDELDVLICQLGDAHGGLVGVRHRCPAPAPAPLSIPIPAPLPPPAAPARSVPAPLPPAPVRPQKESVPG